MSAVARSLGWDPRALAGVALYLVVMVAWIYGRVDPGRIDAAAILVAATHLVVGFLVGRWWTPALVLSLLVLGAPAGTPEGQEGPLLLDLALYEMPIGALLLLLGVIARRATTRSS